MVAFLISIAICVAKTLKKGLTLRLRNQSLTMY